MNNRPLAPPVRVGAWAAFLVLAGLIAMHGLGTHGTMASQESVAHASMPVMLQPHVDDMDDVAMLDPSGAGAGMDHLADGCLVILGLVLVLLLGLGLLAPGARRHLAMPVPTMLVLRRARAPDPPDLRRLSVCRC